MDMLTAPSWESGPFWKMIPELTHTSSRLVSVLGKGGKIRYLSGPVCRLLGYDVERLTGGSFLRVVSRASRRSAQRAIDRMVCGDELFDRWRLRFCTASGEQLWLEGMASNFLDDPRLGGILVYWNRPIRRRMS